MGVGTGFNPDLVDTSTKTDLIRWRYTRRTRNTYSKEYKEEAVKLVRNTGSTIAEIASDLGLNPSNLARWCREFDSDPKKALPGKGSARDEEMAALKRVKQERDFLKHAAAFFASKST